MACTGASLYALRHLSYVLGIPTKGIKSLNNVVLMLTIMFILATMALLYLPVTDESLKIRDKVLYRVSVGGLTAIYGYLSLMVWTLPLRFINDDIYQTYFTGTQGGVLAQIIAIFIQSWFMCGGYKALIIIFNSKSDGDGLYKSTLLIPFLPMMRINAPTPHFRLKVEE